MKPSEFFRRWGEGIRQVTPLQIIKINMSSYIFLFLGILWGLYFSFISGTGWLFLILLGSFVLTTTSFIGTLQRFLTLKEIQNKLKGGQDV